jgi:hypothetical protein
LDLEARVAELEELIEGFSSPVTAVTVMCGSGDTITSAIAQGTGGTPITITVVGTCEEEVSVYRDDVTIQGSTVNEDGGPVDTLEGGIDVLTSHRVTLKNLILRDGADTGVQARRGASVTIDNLDIRGFPGAGIGIIRHSFARIDGTYVRNPVGGYNAVYLNDGSTARITNSHFVSENGSQYDGAALGLFRQSSARLDAGNMLENTNVDTDPTYAQAINILDTSNLRIQRSDNVVTGNILLESNSAADFRNVIINGQVDLHGQVHTTMSGTTTVNGDVTVQNRSLLESYSDPGPVVSGTVTCSGESAVSGGAALGLMIYDCSEL